VIADEEKPIAIAGVIGGKETAMTVDTKNIIFESANFAGPGIRKTAQRLKVFTDASYRFEREIDPENTMPCLQEALKLAQEIAGGKVNEEIIDVYFEPRKEKEIEFEYGRVENLLGVNVPKEKALSILNSLELKAASDGDKIKITIPTFRIDIEKVNDVIEEIARIYGYENINAKEALVEMKQVRQDELWEMEREVRNIWKGLGFFEVYNYSLISEKDIVNMGLQKEGYLELKNYLSEDYKFFRTSLIPRMLKNVQENLKYKSEVPVFELGRVAFRKDGELPLEKRFLSGVLSSRNIKNEDLFYVGKGKIEAFLENLGFQNVRYVVDEKGEFFWHKGRFADIIVEGKPVGKIGEIHPQILAKLGLEERVFCFEIDEEELAGLRREAGVFVGINKMPISEFDLAVVVDKGVEWQKIKDLILGFKDKNIIEITPFDIYEGASLGENKKSVAFKIVCQAENKTLSDEEIKSIMERIIKEMEKIGGEIRK
jgi:phenylalanyl-tRNA synthetase beta chain